MSSEGCCLTWKADVKGSFKERREEDRTLKDKFFMGVRKIHEGVEEIYYDF